MQILDKAYDNDCRVQRPSEVEVAAKLISEKPDKENS